MLRNLRKSVPDASQKQLKYRYLQRPWQNRKDRAPSLCASGTKVQKYMKPFVKDLLLTEEDALRQEEETKRRDVKAIKIS